MRYLTHRLLRGVEAGLIVASVLAGCGSPIPTTAPVPAAPTVSDAAPVPAAPTLSDAAYVWCKDNSSKVINAAATLKIISFAGDAQSMARVSAWDDAGSAAAASSTELAPACLAAFAGR